MPVYNPAFINSLTTTGTSGAASVSGGVLNVPQYTGGGSSLKLPTYTVGASGADFTTIQPALDAATAGGTIYLTDASYTITTALLIKGPNVRIVGNKTTTIQCDGAVATTLIKSNSTTFTRFNLENITLKQTNATVQGIAIDGSNLALSVYKNLTIDSFGTAIQLNDTANLTFYNRFADIFITGCNNGIIINGTTPTNDNMFMNIRTSLLAGGAGFGLKIVKGQSNNFYNCDFEPGTATGITGIALAPASNGDVYDTQFFGVYVEGNATGISINSNTQRTSFFGGQVVSNTANLSDSGQDTQFFGTDIGFTSTSQYTNGTWTDTSNASKTFSYINNTNFAHASSHLIKAKLQNATDTSNVLRLENSGTGKSISAANGTTETFSVDKTGAIVGVSIKVAPRINTTASSATPAINTDTTDQFNITALAVAITSMTTSLTGTPADGQKLLIRIKDNGTARAITWGTSFVSSGSATLLATTVISKTHLIGLIYDSVTAKWVCQAVDATGY